MKRLIILLFLAVLFLSTKTGFCQNDQDSTKLYKIETNDGNEYVGFIINQDSEIIRLKTTNIGEISILRKNIFQVMLISKEHIKNGSVVYDNLHSSRYFCSSNGYGLGKGNAYYQNMWIFYNQFGYGFTNNLSVGVGIVPLFLFAGASSPVWITPKVTIPLKKDKVNLGIGILAATVLGENTKTFGFAYGVSTFGSGNNNISLGIGYGYYGSSWAERPVISVSGKLKAGKRGYIMTENYYISVDKEHLMLSMIGGRSLIKRVALDYGLVIPISSEMNNIIAIPWLGITIPFDSN